MAGGAGEAACISQETHILVAAGLGNPWSYRALTGGIGDGARC
jgi:hypothetical protein